MGSAFLRIFFLFAPTLFCVLMYVMPSVRSPIIVIFSSLSLHFLDVA